MRFQKNLSLFNRESRYLLLEFLGVVFAGHISGKSNLNHKLPCKKYCESVLL